MIDDIKISNIACYDKNGIDIIGLKRINFFYGPNGCGKTTISNYLGNLEDGKFRSCSVKWKANTPLKTLVYNKQFRENNFDTSNGDNIAGIFTLGQEPTEDLGKIALKKDEVTKLRQHEEKLKLTLMDKKEALKDNCTTFSEDCWKLYRQYENDFKAVFVGHIKSKKTFSDKILCEAKSSNSSAALSFGDLKIKARTLLDKNPQKIEPLGQISPLKVQEIERDAIWKKNIVGKKDVDIAALITKLGNSDWVSQGKQYIGEDSTCPFCQKSTVDELFTQQIEKYFDESFEQNKNRLAFLKKGYQQAYDSMIATLNQIEQREKSNSDTKLNIDAFVAHMNAIRSQFSENVFLMQGKLENASQPIELIDTKKTLDAISELIEHANEAIDKHNQLVKNHGQERQSFQSSVWKFLVDTHSDKIGYYKKHKKDLQSGIDQIYNQIYDYDKRIQNLDDEIVSLSKNVTSVQPAVDKINRLLTTYGFTNFSIVSSRDLPNHYTIRRENGDLARHTLSEGEITFITFLYFIQLAEGALDPKLLTENLVLVIDDPICSLDSNVLHVVSTIVKDLIKTITGKENKGKIKQLILLTHNVYFHKEASFQGARSNGDKDMHFWILKKSKNTTIIPYNQKNPIKSDYELLWEVIKERERNFDVILLPNAMRRILEYYFKFLGNVSDDYLISQFDTVEDKQICRSLISWMHDGSHTIMDPLYGGMFDSSFEQYMKVFENIFEHTNNSGHHQMMMGRETGSAVIRDASQATISELSGD